MAKDEFHQQTTIPDLSPKKLKAGTTPKMVGPYKIESLLSKGGMSLLYLGTHPESANPLVVKVLSPKFLKSKEMVSRFLKESQIIRLTNHPNIVKLYGHGKWEKGLYIAMEFIQGISLRQFILQKSLSRKRALDIILQVAYALCHLHTHGVIHRDLKPENILITESGEIKVIDFGIAQISQDFNEDRITQSKRLMGTPTYMSPEQKEDPMHLSYSSDIFSLGVITYELILGRLSHGVIHLSLLPKGLRRIIDQALKIDPKERYQDIVDFITDISQYIQSSREEKDTEEEEIADEWLEKLSNAQEVMFPESTPKWPQIEAGLAKQQALSLTGMYCDYFNLAEQKYLIVLAEPVQQGISSLISTSVIRGMVRMAIAESETKKMKNPAMLLEKLNEVLTEDTMKKKFNISMLMLDPKEDQLSFVSCGSSSLFHLAEGTKKTRVLTTENGPIGETSSMSIVDCSDNWRVNDTLMLCSTAIEKTAKMELLDQTIVESAGYPAQNQAEKILKTATKQNSITLKQPLAVLTIQRT